MKFNSAFRLSLFTNHLQSLHDFGHSQKLIVINYDCIKTNVQSIQFYRVRQIPFFLENPLKKYWIFSQILVFYWKILSFRLIMENNSIKMAASSDHAVANTISTLSIVCSCIWPSVNCLWLVGVILIFGGSLQTIVHRCQIAAPRWPNDISSAADNVIFKNRQQNFECSCGSVARSAVLLKPNDANIFLFNFCEQKFVTHGR